MKIEDKRHCTKIISSFIKEMTKKYEKGSIEHDGHMLDYTQRELLEFAIEEAIDQVVYLMTLRQKMKGR